MNRFRLLFATGVLLLAGLPATACDTAPAGPAVVTATVVDDGVPVPGATVDLRLLNDSSATAVTDSAGRARVELAGAEGPGMLEVASDTTQPRPQRVYAPLLMAPGESADVVLEAGAGYGHYARYAGAGRMGRWGRAVQALDAIEHHHAAAMREQAAAGQRGEPVDFRGAVDSVRVWLDDERDPELRSALWTALVSAGLRGDSVTEAEADRALTEIEADAAIWRWRPSTVASTIRYAATVAEGVPRQPRRADGQDEAGRRALADRRAATYLDRVIDAHDDTLVQPVVLLHAMRLADRAGRTEAAVDYYDRLQETHPESWQAELARGEQPGTGLGVGRTVPDVPLPALDSTARPIVAAELAGPATLVDFWAAWCTPCVAEMPVIHDAYKRFSDRGFDVVSISYDASRDDVARFREQYPMPWRHSFVGAEALSDGEVAAAWGVNGLPSAFLVGLDGTIIALEGELRGEELMETLERVLGG